MADDESLMSLRPHFIYALYTRMMLSSFSFFSFRAYFLVFWVQYLLSARGVRCDFGVWVRLSTARYLLFLVCSFSYLHRHD